MKNLILREKLAKKLVDQYVGPYFIDKIVSTNTVKLQLPTLMRIYPVVNVSQIVQYKKQVGEKKIKEIKPVEVERVEGWKVKKIINKRKVRELVKYLVQQKRFIVEYNTWKRKKNLENTKKAVARFERRLNTEVRQQERLDLAEERDFRKKELPGKYIAKMLYRWNNRKFEVEYLKKLIKNWQK